MLKYCLILCFVQCGSGQHLVKKEEVNDDPKPCPPCHMGCKKPYKSQPLDCDETFWSLRVHNFYRNRMGMGEITTRGNSHSSNMHTLSYNSDLQDLAQYEANACTGIVKPDNGSTVDSSVGRNIYSWNKKYKVNPSEIVWIVRSIRNWFYEIKNLSTNDNIIDKYRKNEQTDNFTQVVWAKSAYVGCGRTYYKARHKTCIYFTCLYKEAGNIPGQSVYQRGKPCSNCGKEKCNNDYPGLCGDIIMKLDVDEGTPHTSHASTSLIEKYTAIWILLHNLLLLLEGTIDMFII